MTATLTDAPVPGTPEWARLITASKVAAILGLSPWDSPRSIWHVIRGDVTSDDGRDADVKSRGHYLEDGVLRWWRDQHPEFADTLEQPHVTHPDLPWASATPDLIAWKKPRGSWALQPDVIVDAKTARDDDEWGRPGTDEMPAYYAAQLMWGMHLSGARRAYIALLTTRLDLREYVLDYDPETAADIERACAEFWASTLDVDAAPPIDDHVATFQTMKRLHAGIDQDLAVQLDDTLARDLVQANTSTKAAEAHERLIRSRVLDAMGSARLAKHGDDVIARRQGNRNGTSLVVVAKTLPTTTTTETPED